MTVYFNLFPWYSTEIAEAKKMRKRLERRWRRTNDAADRDQFKAQRQRVLHMINDAKSKYYQDRLSSCENQRELFRIGESLLHSKSKTKRPTHSDSLELAEKFSDYFITKIRNIRADLDTSVSTQSISADTSESNPNIPTLERFEPASVVEIRKLITSSPSKSCDIDPIPTWLLKKHLNVLSTPITKIVNLSLHNAAFHQRFKSAIVTPLLKKPSLDSENLNHFRPVSNLSLILCQK